MKVLSRYRLGDIAARLVDVVLSTPSTGRLDSYAVVIRLRDGRELARRQAGSKAEANRLAQTIRDYLQRHPPQNDIDAEAIDWNEVLGEP